MNVSELERFRELLVSSGWVNRSSLRTVRHTSYDLTEKTIRLPQCQLDFIIRITVEYDVRTTTGSNACDTCVRK